MDLNGDGIRDMVSGSYSRGLGYFPGRKDGTFGPLIPLVGTDGKRLPGESCAAPATVDWDGDGDLDLVVGYMSGPILWFENVSGKGKLRFAPGKSISVDGKALMASDGAPSICDWDGDGVPDLLLGDDLGGVTYFRGKRSARGLTFMPGETLIAQIGAKGWDGFEVVDGEALMPVIRRSGMNARPFATDVNGDGKCDLIIGDLTMLKTPTGPLNEAQKTRRAHLETDLQSKSRAISALVARFDTKARRELGFDKKQTLDGEQTRRLNEKLAAFRMSSSEFGELVEAQAAVYCELNPLQDGPKDRGFVWVYLRK